jgi:4-diphosphocytidyl-2-C-methyl-D-erythritol kinase
MRKAKTEASVTVFSYPKVNLALDILGKTASGYHEIRTVFHQLSEPQDEIIIETQDEDKVAVECDHKKVPRDATNTVYKAAVLLKQYAPIPGGAKLFIRKKIPLMSGLGGGASNAAAALQGLAKLWGISDENLLHRIADQIGMDCRFFFYGGTALGEHFGEKITLLLPLPPEIQFEIIETEVEISSRWAYEYIDLSRCGKNTAKTKNLIAALKTNDSKGVLENLHNDFEEAVFAKHPELKKLKEKLELKKGGRLLLCGSGGALVRIFHS